MVPHYICFNKTKAKKKSQKASTQGPFTPLPSIFFLHTKIITTEQQ